jgi:hypothetical protein
LSKGAGLISCSVPAILKLPHGKVYEYARKGSEIDMEEFATFPANRCEALAMLYLQGQDVSGMTPEELADAYLDTVNRIRKQFEKHYYADKEWL